MHLTESFHPNNPPSSMANSSFNITTPPKGAWYKENDDQIIIGASTKRVLVSILFVPFLTLWSFAVVFGTYGSQIINREFSLLISIVGIPFLIMTVAGWANALMLMDGRVEITMNSEGGQVFRGTRFFGTTKDFLWSEVDEIYESDTNLNFPGSTHGYIQIVGASRIRFGRILSDERKYYMVKALNELKDGYV